MTEGLFILTTVFIAYVVYQIVNEPKTKNTSEIPKAQPEPQAVIDPPAEPEKEVVAVEPSAPEETFTEEAPVVAAPVEESPAAVEAEAEAPTEQSAAKHGLKNPKTGEVVLVYNNYRFAKRWVKEALVSEGLLKKIYKNNELNADVEAKIKSALAKLEAIDKYRP
jgi:hypothetical protein